MTQRSAPSLSQVVRACWRCPGLLIGEVAWRWLYGIPALALTAFECLHIYHPTKPALMAAGLLQFSFTQVNQSAYILAGMMQVLQPVVALVALWLVPLLGAGWALAFGFGRTAVLHRFAADLPRRPWALSLLQALRLIALAGMLTCWWRCIQWAASYTSNDGRAPDLMAYFAWVFLISLMIFALWTLLSWIFYVSPLLLLLQRQSIAASVAQALRLRAWSANLAQANLGISLIRLVLAVLSIGLSALPVSLGIARPGISLYLWWLAVTVLYLVASAFFAVVRQVIFIEFWKYAHPPSDHVN